MRPTTVRFYTIVAVLLFFAPLGGEAQQAAKVPRVGILAGGAAAEAPNTAFLARMRELGYVEGQTVVFERRFAGGRIQDLPALAVQLVATQPDVIFAPVTAAALHQHEDREDARTANSSGAASASRSGYRVNCRRLPNITLQRTTDSRCSSRGR